MIITRIVDDAISILDFAAQMLVFQCPYVFQFLWYFQMH